VNVVVDASVAIKWFVPEPLSDEADRLLGGGDALFAPDLLLLEFGNTIWKKVRLGGLARGDGDAALAALRNGPVGLVATTPLVERALHLAHKIEHSLHDCVYLAAAKAVVATVATADRRFFDRCSQSSVRSRIAWIADWPSAP
jgi:predicted nucleic acid-binding protein